MATLDYYIVLDNDLPALEMSLGSRGLVNDWQLVDRIARQLGNTGLDEYLCPCQWFAPAAGLALFRRLAMYVKSHPSSVTSSIEILRDLDHCARILQLAAESGWRWQVTTGT